MKVHSPQSTVHSPFQKSMGAVFCLLSFVFCLSQSCTPDPDPTLNYKDREVVDSIFRVKIDTMKTVIDSLCEMRYDSAVEFKVDSIMEVRQAEIKKYLERIRRSEQ